MTTATHTWKPGDYAEDTDGTLWQKYPEPLGPGWRSIDGRRYQCSDDEMGALHELRPVHIIPRPEAGSCPRCGFVRPLGRYGLCTPCIEAEGWEP